MTEAPPSDPEVARRIDAAAKQDGWEKRYWKEIEIAAIYSLQNLVFRSLPK